MLSEPQIRRLKSSVKHNIADRSAAELIISDYQQKLKIILQSTIEADENQSVLLVGPSSAGKSKTVNQTIQDLLDTTDYKICVVRFHGLLHASDEKVAMACLIDSARECFGEEFDFAYEQAFKQAINNTNNFKSFADALKFILNQFNNKQDKQTDDMDMVINPAAFIFILEDFDLFATIPQKQTLLYTLFNDCLHLSCYKGIAIIGLTRRLDVVELLEKRIKSRLVHTQINCFSPQTESDMQQIMLQALTIQRAAFANQLEEDDEVESKLELFDDYLQNESVTTKEEQYLSSSSTESFGNEDCDETLRNNWNNSVGQLIFDKGFKAWLSSQFSTTREVRTFFNFIAIAMTRISRKRPFLRPADFIFASNVHRNDSTIDLLKGLPVAEMILLVSMQKLIEKEVEHFSFDQAFHEADTFTNQHLQQERIERKVAFKCFEHLISLRFVEYVRKSEVTGQLRELQPARLLILPDQLRSGLEQNELCPTNVIQWYTQWME